MLRMEKLLQSLIQAHLGCLLMIALPPGATSGLGQAASLSSVGVTFRAPATQLVATWTVPISSGK